MSVQLSVSSDVSFVGPQTSWGRKVNVSKCVSSKIQVHMYLAQMRRRRTDPVEEIRRVRPM